MLKRLWGHLQTITLHKWRVMKLCFRVGLYKQGLLHDLSKYHPIEFVPGVRYFQGNRSPIDKEKEVKGYSMGWLHHKGHNPHHWEYWLDVTKEGDIKGMPMPKKYIAEMFCDRVAASMTYMKENYTDHSALDYFENGRSHCIMHPQTEATLESWLVFLSENGLDKTVKLIKTELRA